MRRLLILATLVLGLAAPAEARRHDSFNWPISRVWNATVRFFRVDMACPITEKDADTGYFLFNYPHGSKLHPGSVEVLEVEEDGVPVVRVVVQIPAMPSYIEQMMLDKLERKLRKEYGTPPKRVKPEPEEDTPPKKDDDDDGAGGDGEKAPNQPQGGQAQSGS